MAGIPDGSGTPVISLLYVDDEPALHEPTKLTLEKHGKMRVEAVQSARDALERLQEHSYDVIVSDYQMPEMDGMAFLKHLRENGNPVPFILFTGKGRENAAIEAYNAGADSYLIKGGNPKAMFLDLTRKIEQVVSRRRAEEALRKSEEKYRSIFNTFDDLYYQTDMNGVITTLSPSCKKLTGWVPAELIGLPVTVLYPFPDQWGQLLAELLESGSVHDFEIILLNKEGLHRNVSVTSHILRDQHGNPAVIEGTLRDVTERKLVGDALLASEKKYRTLADFLPVMVFEADLEGRVTFANRLTFPTFGISQADILAGIRILDYVAPGDRAVAEKNLKRLFSGVERAPNEYMLVRKDGSRFPAMIRVSAVTDMADGAITGIRGVIIDLTERKQKDEALQQSEASYRGLFNAVRDAICILDTNGSFIDANLGAEEMFLHPHDYFIGKTLGDLGAEGKNDRDQVAGWIRQVCRKGGVRQFEFWGVRKTGAVFPMDVRLYRGTYFGQDVVIALLVDSTERKNAEDALQKAYAELEQKVEERTRKLSELTTSLQTEIAERNRVMEALATSEEKYRSLVEQIGDIVYHIDPQGAITYISPHVLAAMGLDRDRMPNINVFDMIGPRYGEAVRQILDPDRAVHEAVAGFEIPIHDRSTGRDSLFEVNGTPSYDKGGTYTGYSGIVREITERKNLENEVAASLKEKEILLKEIHHRVKNNMQVISSLLSLQVKLMKDTPSREALRESQNRVMSIALVHEKLYQSKSYAEIDYQDYLKKITENLLQSYGIPPGKVHIEIHADGILLPIGKAIPISLLINELVSNSLKYAFPEGRRGTIGIDMQKDGERYTLVVRDDGIGHPEGIDLDHIETLGLQLVNSLVGQILGTIVLKRGPGTEFVIDFTIEPGGGEHYD